MMDSICVVYISSSGIVDDLHYSKSFAFACEWNLQSKYHDFIEQKYKTFTRLRTTTWKSIRPRSIVWINEFYRVCSIYHVLFMSTHPNQLRGKLLFRTLCQFRWTPSATLRFNCFDACGVYFFHGIVHIEYIIVSRRSDNDDWFSHRERQATSRRDITSWRNPQITDFHSEFTSGRLISMSHRCEWTRFLKFLLCIPNTDRNSKTEINECYKFIFPYENSIANYIEWYFFIIS